MGKIIRMILLMPIPFDVAADLDIRVVPEHGGVYGVGDQAAWAVSVKDGEGVVSGELIYSLKSGGWTLLEEGKTNLVDGSCRIVSPPMDKAGSLLLEVQIGNARALGGAVFDWGSIQPSSPEPEDFDAFWQSKVKELEAIPFDVQLEKVDVADDVEYWKITLSGYGGSRIHGQIAKPKKSTGKLPVFLQLQYAGVYPLEREWVVEPAQQGWLAMNVIAHDLPIDREKAFYDKQADGPLKTYETIGNESREESYFLRMYLSCYRAVEYLMNRPDWDGNVLHVRGASQGGLQSIVVAGLHRGVTSVAVNVPAGCDQTGEQVGRDCGWPKWGRWQSDGLRDKRMEAARYFDAVNFARRVTCPAIVGVGLVDQTCPPEGVMAMFNQLQGDKQLVILPVAGHQAVGDSFDPFYKQEHEWVQAAKTGQPPPTE